MPKRRSTRGRPIRGFLAQKTIPPRQFLAMIVEWSSKRSGDMAAYVHRFATVLAALAVILILPSLRPAPAQTPAVPAKPEMTENCPGLVASDVPRLIPAAWQLAA